MNSDTFAELLRRGESDALDFKLTHYDLGVAGDDQKTRERKRAKFAKDLLSFANLWRQEVRYIVIGAKPKKEGGIDAPGVTSHVEGADLVRALDGLVHPCPRFHYAPVEFNGLQYGLIEISADRSIGPFFATKDVGGGDGAVEPLLRKSTLYCRRDSNNVEASPGEQSAVWTWFQQGHAIPVAQFPAEEAWARIVEATQLGNKAGHCILVLALGESARDSNLAHLATLDWTLVLDLDPASQIEGALKQCHDRISSRRALHIVSPDGKLLGDISRATCWYFANGLQIAVDSAPLPTFKQWVAQYGKSTTAKIEQIAAACSGPISVIALCENAGFAVLVRKLIEDIVANTGERATCVAVAESADDWKALSQHDMAIVVPIRIRHFLEGLAAHARSVQMGAEHVVQLPGAGGTPKDLSNERLAYLGEDLELVHLGAGTRPADGTEPIRHFLHGGQITWFELGLQADVERESTRDLLGIVEHDLDQRRCSRVNLYHEPGAGGSTIARRVLWLLHQRYPAIVLRRCAARETAERLAAVYQITERPLLILREGSDVPEAEADHLADLLAGKQMPFVLLQVLRRYNVPTLGPRSLFLRAQLTSGEAERFRVALQHEAPHRRHHIDRLASGAPLARTPFLFGLTAFAEQFTGLRPYVQNHLKQIAPPQIKVLQFLALAYDYGQQALAPSHFAELLQLAPTRPVNFDRVLCDEARGLLVKHGETRWRPVHQLVSAEILELTLSSDAADTRLWKSRLGELAREFVDFCRSGAPVPSAELESVLEQVSIRRNDAELLGGLAAGENRFSRLITDLPNADAKQLLLEHIVEQFPNNPHFWAHLGRFFSIDRKDFVKAESAINHAISLSEDDHVLHHMKGMALRNLAYQMISEKGPLADVISAAKRATECFNEARRLAPDEDYGYISEAQMTLRVLDYARGGEAAVAACAKETTDPWVRESFERVELLLDAVREQRRDTAPSNYEERCRADLDVLYGAHDKALQRWDQLLEKKTANGQPIVYAPPIRRQIVWLQLARCGREWHKMTPKHLRRALDLLEANIQQEPNDDRNIRLWLHGARFQVPPPSLSLAADRIATWRMRGDSLDALYYLYVLKVLEALEGSAIAANEAQKNIELCRSRAGFRRDRTISFEWLGEGNGLDKLIHQDQLGGWDEDVGFWRNLKPLVRTRGVVSRIHAPQAGEIALRWNMKAFFAPAASGMAYGQDENRRVSFFLGFSYEGLRAWSVQPE